MVPPECRIAPLFVDRNFDSKLTSGRTLTGLASACCSLYLLNWCKFMLEACMEFCGGWWYWLSYGICEYRKNSAWYLFWSSNDMLLLFMLCVFPILKSFLLQFQSKRTKVKKKTKGTCQIGWNNINLKCYSTPIDGRIKCVEAANKHIFNNRSHMQKKPSLCQMKWNWREKKRFSEMILPVKKNVSFRSYIAKWFWLKLNKKMNSSIMKKRFKKFHAAMNREEIA